MAWREQQDHLEDCYFCKVDVSGFNMKSKHTIEYPNLWSAIRPQAHDDDVPIPTFTSFASSSDEEPSIPSTQNSDD